MTDVPGFPHHIRSGQVLTLGRILGRSYNEITAN